MKTLKSLLLLTLTGTLLLQTGCGKEEPKPKTPAVPQISLQASQLLGLTVNGATAANIAQQTPDPQVLDYQDLSKAFGIKNLPYLGTVLKSIQTQLQSGTPLKDISIFMGTLPKKYAAQCAISLDPETCLIQPILFKCSDALQQNNWTAENFERLCPRLGRLKAFKPEYLVAVFDGDNTLWYQDVSNAGVKHGVESKRINWAEDKAELLSVYPAPGERASYKGQKTPYDYYKELYKKVGALWNYNYAALAFRGLTLSAAYANWQEMMQKPYAPIPFTEMSDLLRYLTSQGIVAGVASASPIFGVIPTVESLNAGVPLDRIEGLDVFVKDPNAAGAIPIRLSRLMNQGRINSTGQVEKFRSYQEVLQLYGSWVIIDVDHVINARGGKGVQSRSIARRHVADWNLDSKNQNNLLDLDDMRLVLIGGDNFAKATDTQEPSGDRIQHAIEGGNDQGLSEGMNFLEKNYNVPGGTDFIFIRRYSVSADQQIRAKKGKLENFEAYLNQQKLLRPLSVGEVLIQPAITDIKSPGLKGGFLQETPQVPVETEPTPAAETQPSTTATPAATTPPSSGWTSPSPLPRTPTPQANPAGTLAPPAAPTLPAAPPAGGTDQLPPLEPAPPKMDALP